MPNNRISETFIKHLHEIYKNVNIEPDIKQKYTAERTEPDLTDINLEGEELYNVLNEKKIIAAVRRKNQVERMFLLSQQTEKRTEAEETELQDIYNSFLTELSSENAEGYKEISDSLTDQNGKARQYSNMKLLLKEGRAFDDARNLFSVAQYQSKISKGIDESNTINEKNEKFIQSEREFEENNAGKDIVKTIKEYNTLMESQHKLQVQLACNKNITEQAEQDYKAALEKQKSEQAAMKEAYINVEKVKKLKEQLAEGEKELQSATHSYNVYYNARVKAEKRIEEIQTELGQYNSEEMEKFLNARKNVRNLRAIQTKYLDIRQRKNNIVTKGGDPKELDKDPKIMAFLKEIGLNSVEGVGNEGARYLNNQVTQAKLILDTLRNEKTEAYEKLEEELKNLPSSGDTRKEAEDRLRTEKETLTKKCEEIRKEIDTLCKTSEIDENNLENVNAVLENREKALKEKHEKEKAELNKFPEEQELKKEERIALIKQANEVKGKLAAVKEIGEEGKKLFIKQNKIRNRAAVLTGESNRRLYDKAMNSLKSTAKNIASSEVQVKGHTNSAEYNNMLRAIKEIGNENSTLPMETRLENAKIQTERYLYAKKNQLRLWPSATRLARIDYAKDILTFVENSQNTMKCIDKKAAYTLEKTLETFEATGLDKVIDEDTFLGKYKSAEKAIPELPKQEEPNAEVKEEIHNESVDDSDDSFDYDDELDNIV